MLNSLTHPLKNFSSRRTLTAIACSALLFTASSSNAALALYDFGTVETPTYASADTNPNSTAGEFTPAVGLGNTGNWSNTNNGINLNDGNPAPEFAVKPIGKTQAEAYDDNAYWFFEVTPDSGYEANLESLDFRLAVLNGGIRPISYYLSSNISGYNQPIEDPVVARTTGGDISFDLSGAEFQGLSGPIQFRLYLYSDNSGSSGSRWTFDNVTLNGVISPIPEPSMLGLLSLGGLLLARRRG